MSKTVGFKSPIPKAEADAFVAKGKETYAEADEPMKRLTLDLPESLHKTLKLKAVEEGSTIRDLVTMWIREKIDAK
jgi:hypothetical protein